VRERRLAAGGAEKADRERDEQPGRCGSRCVSQERQPGLGPLGARAAFALAVP
jgi:hypothetical protein